MDETGLPSCGRATGRVTRGGARVYENLIEESRQRLRRFGWRWTLLGRRKDATSAVLRRRGADESQIDDFAKLIDEGTVYWGAIVQANPDLFEVGTVDLPANLVFSRSAYFDSHPEHLFRIARSLFKLKDTYPEEPVLRKAAAIVTDEHNCVSDWRLPYVLTNGHQVYLTSILLYRSWLPGRVLDFPVVPIVALARAVAGCMLAPKDCWPRGFRAGSLPYLDCEEFESLPVSKEAIDEDQEDAVRNPHQPLRADHLIPGASDAVVSVTPSCAACIRKIAADSKLPRGWYVRVGGNENVYSLDISADAIPGDHEIVESAGLRIAFPRAIKRRLRGTVIDYQRTVLGEGFAFIDA